MTYLPCAGFAPAPFGASSGGGFAAGTAPSTFGTSGFGSTTSTLAFGATGFGASAAPAFGAAPAATTFGGATTGFGASSTAASGAGTLFLPCCAVAVLCPQPREIQVLDKDTYQQALSPSCLPCTAQRDLTTESTDTGDADTGEVQEVLVPLEHLAALEPTLRAGLEPPKNHKAEQGKKNRGR